MTRSATIDSAIDSYVANCEPYLRDLSEPERMQMRRDIEEIVREVCAELDGAPADLVGPPFRFVAELRTAAGLAPPPTAQPSPEPSSRVRDRLRALWSHAALQWVRSLMPELRTAWWVARGALVATAFARLTGAGPRPSWLLGLVPYWPVFGSSLLGIGATLAAIYLSVEAGRRHLTRPRRAARAAASVVAVAMAFAIVGEVRSWSTLYAADYVSPYGIDKGNPAGFSPPVTTLSGFSVVEVGSDVTGRRQPFVGLGEAVAFLDELSADTPAAAIYIAHDGTRFNPGPRQAIEDALRSLADEGFLNR